jgi:hypothetical protein
VVSGDRGLLAVLPPGRVAGADDQVGGRVGDERRGRRPGGGRVLRGQPERGQPAAVRDGAAGCLPLPGHVVPAGRLRVALSHPQRHQAAGSQQGRQTREADDPHRRLQRVVHRAGHHRDRVPLLRVAPRLVGALGLSLPRAAPSGAALLHPHAQVLHGARRRHHLRSVDLVGEDARLVAPLLVPHHRTQVRNYNYIQFKPTLIVTARDRILI